MNLVSEYVRELKAAYTRGFDLAPLEANMRFEYETKFAPGMRRIRDALVEDKTPIDFPWSDLRDVLPDILTDIRVREINGTAKDALDYAENDATGLKVIAVGGDKLARGLTLEGLCTSYFLRTARMYDTPILPIVKIMLIIQIKWLAYRF